MFYIAIAFHKQYSRFITEVKTKSVKKTALFASQHAYNCHIELEGI